MRHHHCRSAASQTPQFAFASRARWRSCVANASPSRPAARTSRLCIAISELSAAWRSATPAGRSADDAVLVHVQDVELAVAVGEVELDSGADSRVAVSHLGERELEAARKV